MKINITSFTSPIDGTAFLAPVNKSFGSSGGSSGGTIIVAPFTPAISNSVYLDAPVGAGAVNQVLASMSLPFYGGRRILTIAQVFIGGSITVSETITMRIMVNGVSIFAISAYCPASLGGDNSVYMPLNFLENSLSSPAGATTCEIWADAVIGARNFATTFAMIEF